ncbi:putative quinol monooxygenase [Oceaniglobus indicus]|uniref:putative quinol monooxygenase n=1 Tax=Oceaniglobus indicus TaxID=2047749 RepID=UPI000C19E34E|nr:putative quinol monooxygenase [Oceaniglobus indicus]
MFAVLVDFHIKPDRIADFIPLVRENAAASLRNEQGCHRFDVLTDPDHPGDVFLYELYTDLAAFHAHLETAHFKTFDEAGFTMIDTKQVRTFRQVVT